MYDFSDIKDHDRVGNDRVFGTTLEESYRTFAALAYEGVIEYLDQRRMIDVNKVGISGFSRTVWFVSYMLTHAEKQRFRTAALTDGIDGGYFEYIAEQLTEFDVDNGGKSPFGKDGLKLWMRESPGFNLDRVHIPVRLVSIEDRLALWEWYVALKLQNRPVELIEIPDGSHMLEKPSDRYIAMQGLVDWFRFWLQGYERPNPENPDQYKCWEHLRELRDAEDKAAGIANPPKPQ